MLRIPNSLKEKLILGSLAVLMLSGCLPGGEDAADQDASVVSEVLTLPRLDAVELEAGRKLRVVVTTSVAGDVVAHVGGELISLTVLMSPGQDPHSYEMTARDLTAVTDADVTLVNGWDLEGGLLKRLNNAAERGPVLPLSANLAPLVRDDAVDPHVWLNPYNVLVWVDNVESILSALDPGHAIDFRQKAANYRVELDSLISYIDDQLVKIREADRKLVTNHDALGHFAAKYNFEIIGTIIPALDSLAEPSAGELAQLVKLMSTAQVCVLYTELTAADRLAKSVAAELDGCESVEIIPLYTGALGPIGSPAGSYVGMMRENIDAIASGQSGRAR